MVSNELGISTRFHPPALGEHNVRRKKLISSLTKFPPKKLTTIVAPPGYGKTSFAGQWFSTLTERGVKTAWITLGVEDSDPLQFGLSILGGVSSIIGNVSPGFDPGDMSVSSVESILITRLHAVSETVVIFLDEFNCAQSSGNVGLLNRVLHMRELLHIKFVLVSRFAIKIHMSALNLSEQIRNITEKELAFSNEEADEFFCNLPIRLEPAEVTNLNLRTEGWVVALQMIRALIGDDNIDHSSTLSSLEGGNVEIGRYLSEQVFSGLSQNIRRLLIQTAKLPEVCRDLAVAVTDEPDVINSYEMLREHSLPIVSLDHQGRWIRYHPVFGSFLQEEGYRQGFDYSDTLGRAALWFRGRGDLDAAVKHALLANNANLAARMVEESGGWRCVYASERGGTGILRALASRSKEVNLLGCPLTTLGFAVVSAKEGRLAAAIHYLSMIEGARSSLSKDIAIDIRVVAALVSIYTDSLISDEDLTLLENHLSDWGPAELVRRGLLLNMLSYNFLRRSNTKLAMYYGHLAIQCLQDGGAHYGTLHLYTHVGQALLFSGDAAGAEENYLTLIREVQTHIGKGTDLDAIGQVLCSEVQVLRGELGKAADGLQWALPHIARHDAWFDLLAAGIMAEQMLYRAAGNYAAAILAIESASLIARRRGLVRLERLVERERIALLIASGEIDEAARQWQQESHVYRGAQELHSNDFSLYLRGSVPGLLWIRIHLARGETTAARTLLDRVVSSQHKTPIVPRLIELAALEFRLLMAEKREQDALTKILDLFLKQSLADYRAIFLVEGIEFKEQLLGVCKKARLAPNLLGRIESIFLAPQIPHMIPMVELKQQADHRSGLTPREISVIQLLSGGLSNKAIGNKLCLSDNTVKYHLRNIFTKLKVANRTGAVTAARTFGLEK